MAQTAVIVGAASSNPGGWSGTYTNLNDAYDTTYVESTSAPAESVVYYPITDVSDPQVHTGHVVYYRYAKSAAAGAQIDLTVALVEALGGGSYTTIGSSTHTDISESWTDGSFTLTTTQAATITNYGNLEIKFRANQV